MDIYINSRKLPEELVEFGDLIEIKRVPTSAPDPELNAQFKEAEEQVLRYRRGGYSDYRAVAICFRGNKDYRLKIL